MGTRSNIGRRNLDGSYDTIYCHFDGYPEHNGRILLQSYSDPDKIDKLLKLGDLSVLGKHIGRKHDFESYNTETGECNAYGRDRGETNVDAIHHGNITVMSTYLDNSDNSGAEYVYIWDSAKELWTWSENYGNGRRFHKLTSRVCGIKSPRVPKAATTDHNADFRTKTLTRTQFIKQLKAHSITNIECDGCCNVMRFHIGDGGHFEIESVVEEGVPSMAFYHRTPVKKAGA